MSGIIITKLQLQEEPDLRGWKSFGWTLARWNGCVLRWR